MDSSAFDTPFWRLALWTSRLLVPAAVVVVGAFGALCAFAWPSVDDYIIANKVFEHGLLGSQRFWYHEWSGKYFGMLSMSGFVAAFGLIDRFWLAPLLVLAGAFAALWLLVMSARDCGVSRLRSAGVAAVLFAVLLANLPDPNECVYWLTGAYAYMVGGILLITLLGLLVAEPRGAPARTAVNVAVPVVAFCTVGCAETLMLPLATATGLWLVAAVLGRMPRHPRLMLAAAGITVGAVVMLLAPGNAARGEHFPEAHDFFGSLVSATGRGLRHAGTWSLSPALIGAGLLLGPAIASSRLAALADASRLHRWGWALVATGTTVAVCYFPVYWATDHSPPGRVVGLTWFAFAAVWFSLLVPAGVKLARAKGWQLAPDRRLVLAKALIAIGLLANVNVPRALVDLASGDAQSYRAEQLERVRMIRSPGATVKDLQPLRHKPHTLFFADTLEHPGTNFAHNFALFHEHDAARTVPASAR